MLRSKALWEKRKEKRWKLEGYLYCALQRTQADCSVQYFASIGFRADDLVKGITDRGLLLREKRNLIGNEQN